VRKTSFALQLDEQAARASRKAGQKTAKQLKRAAEIGAILEPELRIENYADAQANIVASACRRSLSVMK